MVEGRRQDQIQSLAVLEVKKITDTHVTKIVTLEEIEIPTEETGIETEIGIERDQVVT